MKTIKILLLVLALGLLTSCSKEEQAIGCNCSEVRYTLPAGSISYQYHSTVAVPSLDCGDANDVIHYNGSYHVKVLCN